MSDELTHLRLSRWILCVQKFGPVKAKLWGRKTDKNLFMTLMAFLLLTDFIWIWFGNVRFLEKLSMKDLPSAQKQNVWIINSYKFATNSPKHKNSYELPCDCLKKCRNCSVQREIATLQCVAPTALHSE